MIRGIFPEVGDLAPVRACVRTCVCVTAVLLQIADITQSSLVSEGPLVRDLPGPMCCFLYEGTLFVLLRTGSTQNFMKRPDMTERLLTDA